MKATPTKALCLTMALLLFAPVGTALAALRLAVMDFAVNGAAAHLGEATGEILRTEFSGKTGLEVVERAQLEVLAKEQKLQLSGLVDEATAIKAGKLLGANYIIVGAVNAFGKVLVLTARVIDVQKGLSISGFKQESTAGEDGLYAATELLSVQIAERIVPGGSPIMIKPVSVKPVPTEIALPTPQGTKRPSPAPAQAPEIAGSEKILLKLESLLAVTQPPSRRTILVLKKETRITKIWTYHYNGGKGSSKQGKIGLKSLETGDVVGTWRAVGNKTLFDTAPGGVWPDTGATPWLYWHARPNAVLPPGRYILFDTEPFTWSTNEEMGNRGCAWVYGVEKQ